MGTRQKKQLLKDLLEDDELLDTLNALIAKAVDTKLLQVQSQLEKQDSIILDLQSNLDKAKNDIIHTTKDLESALDKIKKLTYEQNKQEQYSRRNCVRVYGVKESPKENTDALICQIAKENLSVDLEPKHIDRSHRVGRQREPVKSAGPVKPRPIIVKLTSYKYRQLLITNRRSLKNTGMGIQEDLTDINSKLLAEARHHVKVDAAWSSDGRIFVIPRTSSTRKQKKIIRCKEDLDLL